MASTFPGHSSTQQPSTSGIPSSMLGFGPSPTPYFGSSDPAQRLQYYSSQQQAPAASGKEVTGRRLGKVKFFDTQKGFGFINDYKPEELGNEEVFVHYTSITAKSGFRSLAEGEEAEYEVIRGSKGYQATNVTGPGGQQVIGDSRSRNTKNTFIPMSPYAAMYPYIQQDPNAFYAASPYNQPMLLMPQGDYRANSSLPPATFRQSVPYPGHPSPSPYAAPALPRGYDIGKDFAGMNIGAISIDEGVRPKPASSGAPFGGMFGAMPTFDTLPHSSSSPFIPPRSMPATSSAYRPYIPTGAVSARSNSLDTIEKAALATGSLRDPLAERIERHPENNAANRPPSLHSRSSSLLYASKNA